MKSWKNDLFFGLRHTMTKEQEVYVDSMAAYRMTIVNAKSGTGKTTLAVATAKMIGKPLLYVFNPTEEKTLGYTPGSPEEKEEKYLQPLKDALKVIGEKFESSVYRDKYGDEDSFLNKKAWVEAKSHVYARGSNHSNKTVIIDEAQNWTRHDLKKMLTRLHDNCTVIVIGHEGQVDLPNPSHSGFPRLIEHFSSKHYVNVCELTKNFRGELSQDADEL